MRFLFAKHFLWYLFLLIVLSVGGWYTYTYYQVHQDRNGHESTTVKTTDVVQSITVAGRVEAKQVARLGFPVTGTIQRVYQTTGATVETGDVIASLTTDAVIAEYNAAREQVRYYEGLKAQLERGATAEDRSVAATNVAVAEAALEKTKAETEQAVQNARKGLLSSDLIAYPTDPTNDDIPPTINGNYLCGEEGYYLISLYSSAADSGRSYRLSGLSEGTFAVMTDTPVMLGECGLYIQFDANENYRQSDWVISIPNKRGAGYVAAKNAYDLAITQQATAIKAAEEALTLARESERSLNAPSTPEIIAQAEANVATAKARLAATEARITDYTIRAPFPGVITNVDMKVGEAANQNHTVTVVYEGDYELKAQIPEIDIKKVSLSSSAEVLFDADPNTTFPASITFISPLSSDVSGVSYYDATIELTNQPDWIREGLNADVIIKHETRQAVTALPKRYLITENNNSYVLIQNGATTTKTRVDTGLVGTDGLVEIRNLPVGTSVVRP